MSCTQHQQPTDLADDRVAANAFFRRLWVISFGTHMCVLLIVALSAMRVYAGETNVFRSHYDLNWCRTNQPVLIEASKADFMTNGITLGRVVANLGLGWIDPVESVGIVRWHFTDGRTLNIWPDGSPNEVLVLKTNQNISQRFWFTTNAVLPSYLRRQQRKAEQ